MQRIFSLYIKPNFIYLCAVLLFGCSDAPHKPGIWEGKSIPKEKAEMLRGLNTQLFKAIKTDQDEAELLLSESFLHQNNIPGLFSFINSQMQSGDYYLLKDYYVVNKRISRDDFEENEHPQLNYFPLNREMYFAFFIPKNTLALNKVMLTVAYGKYDYGWKANHIVSGYYTQNGKTAEELYKIAADSYAKGYLINALNNINMAIKCLNASNYLRSPIQDKVEELYSTIATAANAKYQYPIELNNIKGKPQITAIGSTCKDDGLLQYVYYLTKINLTDTNALRAENNKVKQQLDAMFPGFHMGKKSILYSAMREKPTPKKGVPHVNFTEVVNDQK